MKRKIPAVLLSLTILLNLLVPISSSAQTRSSETENPFEQQDVLLQKEAEASTQFSSGSGTDGDCISEDAGSNSDSYIVQFCEDATLSQIYNCVSNYTYTLLADSSERLFSIETGDINSFKSQYKDIISAISKNKTMSVSAVPDDTYYSKQWALTDLNLPDAWDITEGSTSVRVAVIDTGFNAKSADFNTSDSSSGNYVSDGCDLVSQSGGYTSVKTDRCGHGTSVISIIAAATNNASGIAGACWNVTIVPYRVGVTGDDIEEVNVIKAIIMAADAGCDVINMSFGTTDSDSAMQTAIDYAAAKGCILVAAAGNDGETKKEVTDYPASYNNVISVASVDGNNTYSTFSNYNSSVDVSAPGENIYVAYPEGGSVYNYESGTSYSSPYVAAIAALARSLDDNITSAEFMNLIETTSTDLGSSSWDEHYGWGLINAKAMLEAVSGISSVSSEPAVTLSSSSLLLKAGASAALTASVTSGGTDTAVTWTSSNSSVASVNESGKVTGVSSGKSVITATADGASASCTVTVDTTAPVFGSAVYSTKSITNKNVKVTVHVSGATVSSLSKTFKSNGSYTFTASDAAGNKARKKVTVKNIDKTAPKIKASVAKGKKTRRTVKVTVSDAHLKSKTVKRNGKRISWKSGKFKSKGKYIITAKDKAGNVSTYWFKIY